MSFQGAINQALGTASEIAGGVTPGKPKADEKNLGLKQKTSTFKNFDEASTQKAQASLKNEIKGKKAQVKRVSERIQKVKRKSVLRDTGNVVPMNID